MLFCAMQLYVWVIVCIAKQCIYYLTTQELYICFSYVYIIYVAVDS
jgi:hypothetical protein